MSKTYYIISDLHLSADRLVIVKLFEQFLNDIAKANTQLYILGDFFDYWIGDDDPTPFNQIIADKLKKARDNGLEIFLMHGNRDFLIGRSFAKKANISLIDDPFILKATNQEILLMHGDLLCTDDKSYQLFRKLSRNILVKKLYLSLPLSLRLKLAKKIRQKSQQKNQKYKIIDVTEKGIQKYINGYQTLIHGHTHLMDIHHKDSYTRYVLGDWFKTGSYIKIQGSDIVLKHYPEK
ncbi:UDP-2,3-diacylglucosamine diphosphatase [Facilibium subflavum]|uniref:UDP-2,3-diacylglucosamine diphosphatase n=1 Tax=Facilibium subflavum TaxID=2219058 RepID=UPI001F3577E7